MTSDRIFIESEKLAQAANVCPKRLKVYAEAWGVDMLNIYGACRIWRLVDIIWYSCNFYIMVDFCVIHF